MPSKNKNFRPKPKKGSLKKIDIGLKKYFTPKNIYKGVVISGVLGLLGTVAYKNKFPDKILNNNEIQQKLQNEIKEIEKSMHKCYSELIEMEKKEDAKLDKFFKILDVQINNRTKAAYELSNILRSYMMKKTLNKDVKYDAKILYTQNSLMKKTTDELSKISKTYQDLKENKTKEIKSHLTGDDKLYSLGELDKCNKLKENIQARYSLKIADLMKRINDAEKSAARYGYNIQKYRQKLELL